MRAFSAAVRSVELRAYPREQVNRPARLLDRSFVHDAVIKDISPDGARLVFQGPAPASDSFVLVDLATANGHICTVVWRRGTECGLRFLRTQSLRGLVSSQFDPAKRIWQAGGRR